MDITLAPPPRAPIKAHKVLKPEGPSPSQQRKELDKKENYPKVAVQSPEDSCIIRISEQPSPPKRTDSLDSGGGGRYANVPPTAMPTTPTATAAAAEPMDVEKESKSQTRSASQDLPKFFGYTDLSGSGGGCLVQSDMMMMSAPLTPGPVVVHQHVHHHFHHNRLSADPLLTGFALSGFGGGASSVPDPMFVPTFTPIPPYNSISIGDIMKRNLAELEACGWYHGRLSLSQSSELLKDCPLGTFLVRDSASPDCFFSLSIQQDSSCGPDRMANSVRIRFFQSSGKFQLDCISGVQKKQLPCFDSVVELVEFYVKSPSRKDSHILLDENNMKSYPIFLKSPLYKHRCHQPPSLQHLIRLAINRELGSWQLKKDSFSDDKNPKFSYRAKNLQSISQLPLPSFIQNYLKEYPHTI